MLTHFGRFLTALPLLTMAIILASPSVAETPSETRIENVFLDPGPFAENEISVIVPFIPVKSGQDLPASLSLSPNHFVNFLRYNYTTQLTIRRVGDAFAFRLFLHGPDVVERFPSGAAFGAYNVVFIPTDTTGNAAGLHLGFLTADNFSPIDTAYGQSLVTDWAWSPGHYQHWKSRKQGESKEQLNRLWQLGSDTMSPDQPIASYTRGMMTIEYYSTDLLKRGGARGKYVFEPGELSNREILDQMVYGDDALRQIEQADSVLANLYGDFDERQGKLEEVIEWLKVNFNPVAPYRRMSQSCGSIPYGWEESRMATALNLGESSAELQKAVAELDAYADCIEALWDRFDYEAYEAVYPDVLKQVEAWLEAGGTLFKEPNWVYPQEGYIRGYAHVHPENVDLAFARRIEQATLPNSSARMSVSQALRYEARDRAVAAQKRAERQQEEARRRAAQRQLMLSLAASGTSTPSFEDIANTDLLGMQENARVAAETGDTSLIFDSSGNIATKESPDLQFYDLEQERQAEQAVPGSGSSTNEASTMPPPVRSDRIEVAEPDAANAASIPMTQQQRDAEAYRERVEAEAAEREALAKAQQAEAERLAAAAALEAEAEARAAAERQRQAEAEDAQRLANTRYVSVGESGLCFARGSALDLARTEARNAAYVVCREEANAPLIDESRLFYFEENCNPERCPDEQFRCKSKLQFFCSR